MDAHHQARAGDSHVVDITHARQLRNLLDAEDFSAVQLSGGCSTIIGQVSELTRNVRAWEYKPQHVSVGPYHRNTHPHLARDDEKAGCVRAVLSTSTTEEVCLDELARHEEEARSCYDHSFDMTTSSQFLRMLLHDGCYLLAWLKGADDNLRMNGTPPTSGHVQETDHRNGAPSCSATSGSDMLEAVAVVRDVFFLVENQIPFFVVDKIHQLTVLVGSASTPNPIVEFARKLLTDRELSVATPAVDGVPGPGNLLHLLHMHLTPTAVPLPPVTGQPVGRWHRATEYHSTGIEFKRQSLSSDGVRCILDVKLDSWGSTLKVPRLNIDAETWRLLRNLMALEQLNPEAAGSHVTAYCVFMSQMACKAGDVELLSRRGIIVHGLGNDAEVAGFFADLCKGIVFDPSKPGSNYLRATNQALEKRYQSRLARWMAWLRHRYSNPWLALGLMVAVVLLACAVVQAVYSVLSYIHGKH